MARKGRRRRTVRRVLRELAAAGEFDERRPIPFDVTDEDERETRQSYDDAAFSRLQQFQREDR